jgi:hypothetical protein
VLFVQTDSEINRQNEDRFQVSGLAVQGRVPTGMNAQKAAGLNIMNDLLTSWYPAAARPKIVDVFIPRRFAPVGCMSLPPLIYVFSDSRVASQVRIKMINHLRSSPLPAMRRVWLEPVLTKATHVRIEILKSIHRVLSRSDLRCVVQGRGRVPHLLIVSGGRKRVFGFVPSCEMFGHLLTPQTI